MRNGLFCGNDPVNNIDPSGQAFGVAFFVVVAVVVVVTVALLVAKDYEAAQEPGVFAETIPGTPITFYNHDSTGNTDYDNLSPTGKRIVTAHECMHQKQPFWYMFENPDVMEEAPTEDTLKEATAALNNPSVTGQDRADAQFLQTSAQENVNQITEDNLRASAARAVSR